MSVRLAVLCVLTAALVVVTAPWDHAVAAQNGRQIAIQFNAQGALSGAGFNQNTIPAVIGSLSTRNPSPHLVSFNEICWTQWDQIQFHSLPDSGGYAAWGHWARTTDDCKQDPDGSGQPPLFGNVIVGRRGPSTFPLNGPYNTQNPNKVEVRGWACLYSLRSLSGGTNQTACTTHLENEDPYPHYQLNELGQGVNPHILQGIPMVVMGDFNLRPWVDGTTSNQSYELNGWWYQLLAEGDRPLATPASARPTHAVGKIDYIFRFKPNLITGNAYIFDSYASDHHWFEAYLSY